MTPWALKESDPVRMATVLHVALQVVDDCKTLLTPFLPHSSQRVYELLGGTGVWSAMPSLVDVTEEGGPDYPVLTGDYTSVASWQRTGIEVGRPLAAPKPIFRKLDPSIVEEELARLEQG